MKNNDLRAKIVKKGLYVYQVADAMGIQPNTLSHYLMWDLSERTRVRILEGIKQADINKKHSKEKSK